MQMCPAARVGRQSGLAAPLPGFCLESQIRIRSCPLTQKWRVGRPHFCRCFLPDACLCPYLQSVIRMVLRGPLGQWDVQWLCFCLSKRCQYNMRNLRKPEIRLPCLVAQHPLRTRTCNVTKNILKTMK